MCSSNSENWVTFDDENLFQPPKKSLHFLQDYQYNPKSNGLKLNLCNKQDCAPSSNPTTPYPSPIIDLFLSPNPPSNSPFCTPNTECSGTPCTPNSGSCILYPIADIFTESLCETSSNILNFPPSANCVFPLFPNKASTPKYMCSNNLGHQADTSHFENPQIKCAFTSPFWNNETFKTFSPETHTVKKDKTFTLQDFLKKETYDDHQKSLNQCSFNYVCEKLQHLKSEDTPDNQKHPSLCFESIDSLSFIPQSLFRSQKKDGWPFMLRIPEKKNMMSSRQWGPIYLRVLSGGILQMYYEKGLDRPFKEFQLHHYCRLSEPKLENFSVSDKIHSVKIEHVTYTEKRRYHPKLEVAHELEIEQMLKLGTTDYLDFQDFIRTVEEEQLRLPPMVQQRKLYEDPEMTVEMVENFWGKINKDGKLTQNVVICQLYCLCFINSGVECFLTLNDAELQNISRNYFGKNNRNLIDIYDYYLHKCVKKDEFQTSRIIKFIPIDGCRFELMRFKTFFNGEELPFSVKTSAVVQGACVELQAFLNMCPSRTDNLQSSSTKYCENITIHFPVPAPWMKALWTVSLQRQRSLKTKMNRRTCFGSAYEIESEPVIQVTVGTAKYEKAFKAVVWKIDRLPDKNSHDQPQSLSCRLELGSDQEIPHDWKPFAEVQFSMPGASISGAQVKSMGIKNDVQPRKHMIRRSCYNLQVEIERRRIKTEGEDPNAPGDCTTQ
ncbi:hypothetical protein GDO86_008997 [Hymenochirus boettgeri]|uniref:Stonin-1 n=1 Tax=Hymenochirus boettgeri TaxID=247094 RepID=A0A8T2JH75_9PIPI|nr:hypothetical protein GDO86_008997 [Hymenochirus boettgeri]